ncbi:histone deacetylase [Leishmania donovani]|uniref:Histone_deacetylase_putative/GeneDB:LmjF.21.1870 n=1 Tax=Leishmania donovani TaxID=5661 RepID=A0A6J8FDX0_LEIDO|nr:histone deacetylase [Leishmania donovani]VDZ44575.1 histone_deacetylase_putative/GeneDB:LmjF.21.1870 [Leishmania donovani]
MPKRQRSDEKAAHHVQLSVESGSRFDAYIRGWMQGTVEQPLLRPSLLPPLTPLPTLAAPSKSGAAQTPATASAATTVGDLSRLCEWTPPSAVMPASRTAVVYDTSMLDHVSPDAGDYERPARLQSTLDHLTAIGLLPCCQRIPARTAKKHELRRVHCRELIDTVDQLDFFMGIQEGRGSVIGQDLFASEHTSRAARMAAGCVIEAVKAVLSGAATNAFAIVRPPGHHAGPANAAGYCLYNNVAVAARAAQAELAAAQRRLQHRRSTTPLVTRSSRASLSWTGMSITVTAQRTFSTTIHLCWSSRFISMATATVTCYGKFPRLRRRTRRKSPPPARRKSPLMTWQRCFPAAPSNHRQSLRQKRPAPRQLQTHHKARQRAAECAPRSTTTASRPR